ncbi:MAG: HAD family hydrolase [Alphaproteobacteria bacterium]
MTQKKLAVFDWNGTLLADTVIGWHATKPCLEFYGVAPMSLKRQREIFDFPIVRFYERAGCDINHVMATKEESNALFQDHYDRLSTKARTRRGAKLLLDWLAARDVTCIILSNYIGDKINNHLERLNIGHYFSYVSANQCNGITVLDTTNKQQRLGRFMDENGYVPDNTMILGDSMEEPEIGRALGITSIGITNGCISEQRLRAARPDYVISALPQTIDIVRQKWML